MAISVYPIAYQSNVESLSDWVSLLTLCLAPLIAHVFAGAPHASYLVSSRPPWHDRLPIFNPTSIIFRYGAIVERRIRTINWAPIDAAAANALFWTRHGWDGSNAMATKSIPYCALLPETARMSLLSVEMLKTIITTVQGVQAAMSLIGGHLGTVQFVQMFALNSVFGPLAIIGLLRLLASPWLTEDFVFSSRGLSAMTEMSDCVGTSSQAARSVDSLLLTSETTEYSDLNPRLRHASYWPNRLFQMFFFLLLLGLWSLAGSWSYFSPDWYPTATSFIVATLYFLFLTVTIVIYAYYLYSAQTDSTVIPCASHWWYKVYSVILLLSMLTLVIVSAVETVKTACGIYTSASIEYADLVCTDNSEFRSKVTLDPFSSTRWSFGIAMKADWGQNYTGLGLGLAEFWVANFTGTCLGQWQASPMLRHVTTLGFANYTNATGYTNWL